MEIKYVKYTSPVLTLLQGLLLLLGGGFLLTQDAQVSLNLFIGAGVLLLVVGGIREAVSMLEVQNRLGAILSLGFFLVQAGIFGAFSWIFVGMLQIALAIMFYWLALLRLCICIHMLVSGVPGFLRTLVSLGISLVLGTVFAFSPSPEKNSAAMLVLGVYLILTGLNLLGRFLAAVLGSDLVDDRTRRRLYFAMPNVVTIPITMQFLRRCNAYLAEHPQEKTIVEEITGPHPGKVNLEVMVHTSRKPGKQLGHVDVALDGKVFTFGNYDPRLNRIGGCVTGGVFAVLPREEYIHLCMTDQEKYIVSFGCVLSRQQLEAVRAKIADIYADTEPLTVAPEAEDLREGDGAVSFVRIGGDVRRVVRGPFKTYFVIASNCVRLADSIIGAAGFDRISRSAMASPGAYLCMLDNMFYRKNTRVIRRTIYLQP